MALLPKEPKKQVQVLLALVPLVLAFVFYQFVWTKRAAEIEDVQTHVEDLNMKNDALRAIVARYGADLPRRLALYEEHVRQLEQLIPRREDVPFLINQITRTAHELGVELAALTPSEEEAGEHYARQGYEVHVLGQYHRIGEYMTAIGSLERIMRPTAVKMSVDVADPTGRANPQLRAIFRLETYISPSTGMTMPTVGANAN